MKETCSSPSEPVYFADNVTSLPVTALWKLSYRQGVIGVLILFALFLVVKLFGRRFPIDGAMGRTTDLATFRVDDIPPEFRQHIEPFEDVCYSAGLRLAFRFLPPRIGNRSAFFSTWLDPTSRFYATITLTQVRSEHSQITTTRLSCSSRLQSGVQWVTAAIPSQEWIPEIVPPQQVWELVDIARPLVEVIARHQARLVRAGEIVTFTNQTLEDELVRDSEETINYLVSTKFLVPLPKSEVDRLKRRQVLQSIQGAIRNA